MKRIARRDLLRATGATLAAFACQPRARPTASPARAVRARPRSRVVVVGGGLSGLASALDLVERGIDVTLLEAQARPGGRILTIRSPFREGLHVEAGATHVVGDPALLRLLHRLEIPLTSARSQNDLKDVEYFAGQRRIASDSARPSGDRLSAQEQALGFEGRLKKYFAASFEADPRAPGWPDPTLAELDRLSVGDYLRGEGASAAFIADVGESLCPGGDAESASALALIRDVACIRLEREQAGGGRVAGGTDRLPRAIAARLGDRAVYGAEVRAVVQDVRGVRVELVRHGVTMRLDAERVILAIPAPRLSRIRFEPALSPLKRRAIAELPLASVMRIWFESDQRFWVARGESGRAETDLPIGRIKDETALQPGAAAILGAYLSGDRARRFGQLPIAERMSAARSDVERVFPELAQHGTASASKYWDEDPYAGGAYAWYRPGQLTGFGSVIGAADGRLHFAGDHTSYRPGFMHGALASSRRVVAEVLSALDVE